MEIRPHDLLRIDGPDALVSQVGCLDWVSAALERAPYVVVRRQGTVAGMVAVGVRGETRSERYASLLPLDAIRQQITPEQLAQARAWSISPRLSTSPALQALVTAADVLETTHLGWGPVGSIGFELASEQQTITAKSDLDLIIRAPGRLSMDLARMLLARLSSLLVRMDIQVETSCGAFALQEYGREVARVMLRTPDGPRLVHDPWEQSEKDADR